MKTLLLAGVALSAALLATGASAADAQTGWYGALDAGLHHTNAVKASSDGTAPDGAPYNWSFGTESDWAGFARVGYKFNSHFRVELEGGYRKSALSTVRANDSSTRPLEPAGLCTAGVIRTSASATCGKSGGTFNATTGMLNAIWDFMPSEPVNPFVGVGLGAAQLDVTSTAQFATAPAGAAIQNLRIDSQKNVLAYQALAGVSWRATERLRVDLTYRHLKGADKHLPSGLALPERGKKALRKQERYKRILEREAAAAVAAEVAGRAPKDAAMA